MEESIYWEKIVYNLKFKKFKNNHKTNIKNISRPEIIL